MNAQLPFKSLDRSTEFWRDVIYKLNWLELCYLSVHDRQLTRLGCCTNRIDPLPDPNMANPCGWRCSIRLQKEQTASNSVWGVYLGLCVAVVMVGFQVLDIVSDRLFVESRAKTVFGNDGFSAKLQGDRIYLGGEINYLMYQALLTILSEYDDVKTISLDSHGGIVFAGRSIAKLIQERGLETYVENRCYSACTLVFAAGSKRTISQEADIGFHGYSFDMPYRFQTVDPIEEQEKDKAYLLTRGIEVSFLEQAFSTDAQNLWRPSFKELIASGFTTK